MIPVFINMQGLGTMLTLAVVMSTVQHKNENCHDDTNDHELLAKVVKWCNSTPLLKTLPLTLLWIICMTWILGFHVGESMRHEFWKVPICISKRYGSLHFPFASISQI